MYNSGRQRKENEYKNLKVNSNAIGRDGNIKF